MNWKKWKEIGEIMAENDPIPEWVHLIMCAFILWCIFN